MSFHLFPLCTFPFCCLSNTSLPEAACLSLSKSVSNLGRKHPKSSKPSLGVLCKWHSSCHFNSQLSHQRSSVFLHLQEKRNLKAVWGAFFSSSLGLMWPRKQDKLWFRGIGVCFSDVPAHSHHKVDVAFFFNGSDPLESWCSLVK